MQLKWVYPVVVIELMLTAWFLFPSTIWSQDPSAQSDEAPGLEREIQTEPDQVPSDGNFFGMKNAYYTQDDGGGIEQIDEDATVIESLILVKHQATKEHALSFRVLGDVVSAASIEREHNALWQGRQSGASGTTHIEGSLGWIYTPGDWTFGLNAGFANEYAYDSVNFGGSAGRSFNEDNTTLTFLFHNYADGVRMIRFDGREESEEDRDTLTFELNLHQVLSPRSALSATITHTSQDGFLNAPYNSVFVGGVEADETTPDSRSRDALTLRYKHAIGEEDAAEVGYRYYADDWGIDAHTLELKYFHYVFDHTVLFEPMYRFYLQSEADFYKESFGGTQREMTSDPDLGDFDGHMFGLKTTFLNANVFGIVGDWDVGVYTNLRSNDLNMFWFVFGLQIPY